MKKTVTLIFSLLAIACEAQMNDKYPFYFNSAMLEFASPVGYIRSLSGETFYKTVRLPATFLSGEFRVKNKFYLEAGLGLGFNSRTVYIATEDTFHHREFLGTCYAGGLFKIKLFRNFYFSPSLDFYYSLVRRSYSGTLAEKSSYLTLGPTIGFEYFVSKRISLNTDLLNLNLGLHFYSESQSSGGYSYATVYKYLSLGVHYNFDWKKKVVEEAK
ncbi:MAG TPA: hypothetical protein VE978_21315 [Chitinophagales bacterium]|nr:hypothetical protein [Chitinophagales bacterium]